MKSQYSNQNAFATTGSNLQGQYEVVGGNTASNQVAFQQPGTAAVSENHSTAKGQHTERGSSGSGTNSATGDANSTASSGGQSGGGQSGGGQSIGVAAQAGSSATNGSIANKGGGSMEGSGGSNSPSPQGYNQFSSGSASGGGASSLSGSAGSAQTSGDPAANPNVSLSLNQEAERQPKAKHVREEGDLKPISVSAGRGWAASRAEGKSTPVSRPVNIVALKDRWLLRSDVDPNAFDAIITITEGPQQAGNQLAVAIRKRVDSWGLSVPGGFWSPTLTIEAASDAQQSVARLERLLEGSGVEIKVVPLTLPNRRRIATR